MEPSRLLFQMTQSTLSYHPAIHTVHSTAFTAPEPSPQSKHIHARHLHPCTRSFTNKPRHLSPSTIKPVRTHHSPFFPPQKPFEQQTPKRKAKTPNNNPLFYARHLTLTPTPTPNNRYLFSPSPSQQTPRDPPDISTHTHRTSTSRSSQPASQPVSSHTPTNQPTNQSNGRLSRRRRCTSLSISISRALSSPSLHLFFSSLRLSLTYLPHMTHPVLRTHPALAPFFFFPSLTFSSLPVPLPNDPTLPP